LNLLITGDFCVSDSFRRESLFDSEIISLFACADYRIVNLEAPITIENKRNEIFKTGPHLYTTKNTTLPLLKKLKIDLVTLANNHIMDYGQTGLMDTLSALKGAGIDAVGAGLNLHEATKPVVLEKDSIRMAILNFAENEWACAKEGRPGAAPLDIIENIKQIQEVKANSEFLIIIIHGGHEYYNFPSPGVQKRYRFLAENGASVIIGHHSHCISGYEVHQGVPIFYNLGNFVFTEPSPFESWYTGLVLNLHIQCDRKLEWELIPVTQSKKDFTLSLTKKDKTKLMRREVEDYCKIIADKSLLNQAWKEFLSDRRRHYMNIFSPISFINNKYIRLGMMRLGFDHCLLRKAQLAQVLNNIRCESHAEAAREIIEYFLE